MKQVILALSCANMQFLIPIWQLFGIQKPIIIEEFDTTIVMTSQMASLQNLSNLIGTLSQPYALNYFGQKYLILLSMIVQSIGIIPCILTTNIQIMIIFWHFINYTIGVIQTSILFLIPKQFTENTTVQIGIVMAFQGLGVMINSQFQTYIIINQNYRISLIINYTIALIILFLDYIQLSDEYLVSNSVQSVTNDIQTKIEDHDQKNNKIEVKNEIPAEKTYDIRELILQPKIFYPILGLICFSFSFKIIYEFIVVFYESKGQDQQQSSLLVTILGAVSVIGRLISGFILNQISLMQQLTIASILMGSGYLLMPFIDNQAISIILCIFISLGISLGVSQFSTIAITIFPKEQQKFGLPHILSIVLTSISISIFVAGQLIKNIGQFQSFEIVSLISFTSSFFFQLSECL